MAWPDSWTPNHLGLCRLGAGNCSGACSGYVHTLSSAYPLPCLMVPGEPGSCKWVLATARGDRGLRGEHDASQSCMMIDGLGRALGFRLEHPFGALHRMPYISAGTHSKCDS